MRRIVSGLLGLGVVVVAFGVTHAVSRAVQASRADSSAQVPQFEFDPSWPKQPFPNYEVIGNVIGLAIDAKEHIWVLHRPQMVTEQEQGAAFGVSDALCCRPAKPVLEIDPAGNVIQTWGGPGADIPGSTRSTASSWITRTTSGSGVPPIHAS
jgi:hypothetical protein